VVRLTLREDDLKQLTVGSDVTLTTDDGRRIAARVTDAAARRIRHVAGRAASATITSTAFA
jgi:hypothetical protein